MAERISQIRVTRGAHPVSSTVRRKADSLDQLVADLTEAHATRRLVDVGRLANQLALLARDLRTGVAPAIEGLEEMAAGQMGVAL